MRKDLIAPKETEATPLPPEYTPRGVNEIISEDELLRRLPICRRTLANWKSKRLIPFIKLNRRVFYDWGAVHQALLRHQRGVA